MKLKEVYLAGFKSYGMTKDSIKLDDINIIIGANSAGKSNFISFLEMISYIAGDAFLDYVAGNGYAQSLIHARRENIDCIYGKLTFVGGRSSDSYFLTNIIMNLLENALL